MSSLVLLVSTNLDCTDVLCERKDLTNRDEALVVTEGEDDHHNDHGK